MEEYDDLATGPSEDGTINLSHNTWKALPSDLNNFATTLLHLQMCNNQLSSIPESIGDLVLLRTLDVSQNQIESIDGAVGKCIRLRRLNVAKNHIKALPSEISNCILLVSCSGWAMRRDFCIKHSGPSHQQSQQEEINASDNQMRSLPQELMRLIVLSVVDVRNNRLGTIPTELSRVVSEPMVNRSHPHHGPVWFRLSSCSPVLVLFDLHRRTQPTLTQLLCDGNSQLESAPANMTGDSNLLLVCLEMRQKFKDAIDPKEAQRNEFQEKSDRLQHELSQARRHIEQLKREVTYLEWERPDRYIYWKARLLSVLFSVLKKFIWARDVIRTRMDRRKTHPLY